MPAPEFNLPVAGSAPNQYSTENWLEEAVNEALLALWNDVVANGGKVFPSRGDAEAAGQSVLVAALSRIFVTEGSYLHLRGPSSQALDPLFPTYPYWGVQFIVPNTTAAWNRANHTGTQPINTVDGLPSALDGLGEAVEGKADQSALDDLAGEVDGQLGNVPPETIKGRAGPDAGAAEDLTPLAVRTMLHLLALEDRGGEGQPWSVGDGKRSWLYLDDAGDLRGPWADALTGMLVRRSDGGPLWSVGGKPGRWGNATSPLCLLDDDENTIRNRYLDRIAASALRVTPRPKLYIAGDSRGDQSSNPGRTPANGWLAHLQMLTAGRFDFDPADNIAVAGSNSEQMLAAVGPLLTAAPGVVVAIISTNDRTQGWSAQRSIDALSIWQAQVLARGHQVIWIAEMPRGETGNTTYALSGANLQAHMRVRQWLLAQASVPGVYVADPWPAMCDPASASGYVKAGLMYDGLHTGVPGARAVAECIAPIINALMPPHPRLIISAADTYTANNPSGALNGNPMMSGTGGVLDGGASGALASGWSVQTGAGMAAVLSKTTLDGLPAQRCVVSGAPTGASAGASPVDPTPHAVVISADIANPANLVPGDVIELTGMVSLAEGSEGCRAVALYLTVTTASGTVTHCAMEPLLARSVPNLDQPDSALSGPAIVPRFTVTEAVTAASVSLMIVGAPHISSQPDIAISATVDFTALSLKKVI